MHAVLHPEKTKPMPFDPAESVDSYLTKCEHNIRAEIWGLYHGQVNPAFPGWRDRFLTRAPAVAKDTELIALRAEEAALLDWTLLIVGSALHLAINNKGDGTLRLIRGMRIDDPFYRRADAKRAYVVGFVRPFVKDLDAIASLRKANGTPPLLSHIASPAARAPFAYAARPFSDAVPSNAHQRSVVSAMSTTIECIQGPPGTGKSTTIFHILHSALPCVAIVTCVQNRAVDAVAEKLCGTIDFVVLGKQDRLGESSKRNTLDAFVSRDPAVGEADRAITFCRGIVNSLHARLERIEGARTPLWRRWWAAYVRWRNGALVADVARWRASLANACAEREARSARAGQAVLRGARAFLCTLDSLSLVPPGDGERIAIVDEAGTVPEYKLPLLAALGVKAIVCIGDQNQLEPFSHAGGKGSGFFQRVTRALHPVPMLVEQYRMHPSICDLVSGAFYGGALVTARAAAEGGGIRWVDYAKGDAESKGPRRTGSTFNTTELEIICCHMNTAVRRLLDEGKTVMIIAFYREQFQRLVRMAEDRGLAGRKGFRVATVDSAQGSEADVVLLSCVRSNPRGAIGFLSNPNRLCVALSRARDVLCVFGHSATLRKHPVWEAVYAAAAMVEEEKADEMLYYHR